MILAVFIYPVTGPAKPHLAAPRDRGMGHRTVTTRRTPVTSPPVARGYPTKLAPSHNSCHAKLVLSPRCVPLARSRPARNYTNMAEEVKTDAPVRDRPAPHR